LTQRTIHPEDLKGIEDPEVAMSFLFGGGNRVL